MAAFIDKLLVRLRLTRNAVIAALGPAARRRECVICLDGGMTHLVTPYSPDRRPIHPIDALFTQMTPYPPNRRPIHPTDTLSTQPTPHSPN